MTARGPLGSVYPSPVSSIAAVLTFWFGNVAGEPPPPEFQKRWWTKSEAFDGEIRQRFGDLHSALMAGEHDDWLDTPRGCVARIIVLDQFSRNMFRDDPRAFASDPLALAATDRVLQSSFLDDLGGHEQLFALMPLMHAESRERQAQSVREFEALAARTPGDAFDSNVDYAYRHKRIVDRFGRYPHRNAVLGRDSTAEELEFLKEPGSSF